MFDSDSSAIADILAFSDYIFFPTPLITSAYLVENIIIGIIPTNIVIARMGESTKQMIMVDTIDTNDLKNIDTFVLKLSCTTEVSELSRDTIKFK